MDLFSNSAVELRAALTAGKVSCVELAQSCLERIEAVEDRVAALLNVDAEGALARAREVDDRRAAGQAVGALAGLPVVVKDNLCQQNGRTTCASKMLEEFSPPYDATVIERLHEADAVILGRTNLDEFAMGSSTENSAFQQTHNPWDQDRTPGGSSGGSAAAVAAGMAPLAIGSDTGGSIRQPAAFCGVVGLKPTYGRVSRYGLVAFASSLDQIGPFGRRVADVALLLEAIAGHDPRDTTSIPEPTQPYSASVSQPLADLRIGYVKEHLEGGADPEIVAAVETALAAYRDLGAQVKEVSLPHSKYGIATYYVIAPSEASSNLARYDGIHYGYRCDEAAMRAELEEERKSLVASGDKQGLEDLDTALVRLYRQSRTEGFGGEVKRRIMLGTYALSAGYYDAYYLKALKVRRLIRQDYERAFEQVNVIAGPTTPAPAFRLGEMVDDPLSMYLQDLFTVGANLAGVPAISLPCGLSSEGLPLGLQLQARPLAEETLLRAAAMYEQTTDWNGRLAPLT